MKNPFSTTTLCWCLSLLLVFHGCASYTVSPAPIPTPAAMPLWQTGDLVAVGADPYAAPDRQQSIFAADLIGKAGVVPIQILVQNHGPRPMKVRRSDITLEFPETRLGPIDPYTVVVLLMGPNSRGSTSTREVDPRFMRDVVNPGSTYVIPFLIPLALLVPIFIPRLIADSAEAKAIDARRADYQAKEFRDAILDTNTAAHGFVYFAPFTFYADSGLRLSEATLVIRIADAEDESRFTDFRLRLSR